MERLQKYIAKFNQYSRRQAEELIKSKQITINDRIAVLGDKVSNEDIIKINQKTLNKKPPLVYYLLNKPRGYISSTQDKEKRKLVIDLVPSRFRVFPVGRLDYNTTGALLLTNDGDLTQKLIHPKFKIEKKYIIIIKGIINHLEINLLKKGIKIRTGYITKKAKVRLLDQNHKTNKSKLTVIIREGKKHQVKLMFLALGYHVQKLHREQFGPFSVKNIVSGKYTTLSPEDVKFLKR